MSLNYSDIKQITACGGVWKGMEDYKRHEESFGLMDIFIILIVAVVLLM